LQQEPTPQKEHVQQFVQHNPQGFVLQQQPYQPQTAGFSDISGGNDYNQTMPQQMSRARTFSRDEIVISMYKVHLTQSAAETLRHISVSSGITFEKLILVRTITVLWVNIIWPGARDICCGIDI
jgi:hypothetical protein